MGRIRLLPDDVASQVAAGEVVERPASVVKELIENSFDAGAQNLEIDFGSGGMAWLRVADDGCGMDRDDALLSLERHATSKIRTGEDLARVLTFGFRGEALPSIASVSRFRMVTREAGSDSGTEILVNGGRIETVRDAGEAPGTAIDVRALFYNVPARQKFLRAESTETAHLLSQIHFAALARPDAGIVCRRDRTEVLRLPPAGSLPQRIGELLGEEFLRRVRELEQCEDAGVRLRGHVSRAGEGKADRGHQYVYVNGRPVMSPVIHAALREAFYGALPHGLHPLCVLFLELDPLRVDCNAHPAKREVRFRDPEVIKQALVRMVRRSLEGPKAAAGFALRPQAETPGSTQVQIPLRSGGFQAFRPGARELPLERQEMHVEPQHEEPRASSRGMEFRGRLGERYLLFENEAGLVLLDSQAARRRVLYERILAQMEKREPASQGLLVPAVVDLTPRDHDLLLRHAQPLAAAGFQIEDFGGRSLRLEGVHPAVDVSDPRTLLEMLANCLRETGTSPSLRLVQDSLARSVSNLGATRAVRQESAEIPLLMAELMRCGLPYACPEGKPVMIQISFSEIERKFGRGG